MLSNETVESSCPSTSLPNSVFISLQRALLTSCRPEEKQNILKDLLHPLKHISNCSVKENTFINEQFLSKVGKCVQKVEEYIQRNTDVNGLEPSDALLYEVFSCFILFQYNDELKDASLSKYQKIISAIKIMLKSAHIWMLNKSYVEAKECLQLTDHCLKTLQAIPREESVVVEKHQAISALFNLELLVECEEYSQALSLFPEIKEMTSNFPILQSYLSDLCHNAGVICFKVGDYESTVSWLRNCYDIRRNEKMISSQSQQILKVLAESYMKWDVNQYWKKAIHAIDLAYAENKDGGYYLTCLHIILQANDQLTLDKLIDEVIKSCKDDEQSVRLIKMLLKSGQSQRALKLIRAFKKHGSFTRSKEMLSLELKIYVDINNLADAKGVVEQYVKLPEKDENLDRNVCSLIAGIASGYFQRKMFGDALLWYNYTEEVYRKAECNRLRNQICYCYIEIGSLKKAEEIIEEPEFIESENFISRALHLKISILTENEKLADVSLKYFAKLLREDISPVPSSTVGHLLTKYCQLAVDKNKIKFTLRVFNKLVTDDAIFNPSMRLKMLRCLLRLYITDRDELDFDKIASYIMKSKQCLEEIQKEEKNECLWLSKICWNVCGEQNVPVLTMFQLCSLGWKLLNMLKIKNSETAVKSQMNNLLLMATSSALYFCQTERNQQLVQDILSEIQNLIEENKKKQEKMGLDETLTKLVLLYEFDVKMKLKFPTLEIYFSEIRNLQFLDVKFFQSLAALSTKYNLIYYRITIESLKLAITKQLEFKSPDYRKISKNFHTLLQVMMQMLATTNATNMDEEALTCVNQILEIVQNKAKGVYPEIELVWTMTGCWNIGIRNFSQGNKELAFEWCSFSIRFLHHIHSFRSVYEHKMKDVFKDLFSS